MAQQAIEENKLSGHLLKWTNYIKGYQRRWFVLSSGILSYYRNQAETQTTCRGSISLHKAEITSSDNLSFTITSRGNQTFHIKAFNEKEKQTWLTALKLAQEKQESEDDEDLCELTPDNFEAELNQIIKMINKKLAEMKACRDVVPTHWSHLQRAITDCQASLGNTDSNSLNALKELGERVTLYRVTSVAVMNKCSEFIDFVEENANKWIRLIDLQNEHKKRLETMVEQLAQQHSSLEQAAKEINSPQNPASTTVTSEDEDDFFFDAKTFPDSQEEDEVDVAEKQTKQLLINSSQSRTNREPGDEGSGSSASDDDENAAPPAKLLQFTSTAVMVRPKGKARRVQVPFKPDYPLNLWSIMKNCIGKELSKIPMPVNFSEPLSMLQRLTEDFEYSSILDKAATMSDSCEQLAYVAAFTVSSYATTAVRTAKPFNPLLGETFECDRTEDLGWRAISEQVSHHPPTFAQHCEGKDWVSSQEFTMTSKFRGKYLQVIPLGMSHLKFKGTNNHYTWRKVTTSVHNIIVGKLWVDQHGEMDIHNHGTEDVCHLKYIPYSYFNRDSQKKVKGWVKNKKGDYKWVISGTWDNKIEIAPVLSWSGSNENPNYRLGPFTLAWQVNPTNPECEKFYNFSAFACQLNEPEEGVAPTDSRLRPDQRLMEQGEWDKANDEKVRLEEKQRQVRRSRESEAEEALQRGQDPLVYEPLWFKQEKDTVTGEPSHFFTGAYWDSKMKQDWSQCPDIF